MVKSVEGLPTRLTPNTNCPGVEKFFGKRPVEKDGRYRTQGLLCQKQKQKLKGNHGRESRCRL